MVDEPSTDPEDSDDLAEQTDEQSEGAADEQAESVESQWERKRRLAEIFGDVLPATTRDERGPGESTQQRESAQDAWLRWQVPPHHGS